LIDTLFEDAGFSPADDSISPFTYQGGRAERAYLLEAAADYLADNLIADVLFKVKGGKEANVYCCRAHRDLRRSAGYDLIALKLYRPGEFRAMKNDAVYRLGREEVDASGKAQRKSRALRAMAKRTKVGKAMRSMSWTAHEYRALDELVLAGIEVPEPVASNERSILMRFVGDEAGAAPTLHDARLTRHEADAALHQSMGVLRSMLAMDRVHGDLSPYNLLWWRGKVTVIDLPQCVDAEANPLALSLFVRDVEHVLGHFRKLGLAVPDPGRWAMKLWDRRSDV
jgi:RIO kinase 1